MTFNLIGAFLQGQMEELVNIVSFAVDGAMTSANVVSDSSKSILALISGVIAPIFAPLGFGDWRISTALITGFMAKEGVVSTLSVLIPTEGELFSLLTVESAISLLVFCLLYTPCVAAIASIRRELGSKAALGVAFGQLAIAWLCAFVIYNIALVI